MTIENLEIFYKIGFPALTVILLLFIIFKQIFNDNSEKKLMSKYEKHLHEMNEIVHNEYASFVDSIQKYSEHHIEHVSYKFQKIDKNFEKINEDSEETKENLKIFNKELKELLNENRRLRSIIDNNNLSMARHLNQINRLKDEKKKLQEMVENG